MKRKWITWFLGIIFVLPPAAFVILNLLSSSAIRSGQAPISVFHENQQRIWRTLLNPWVLTTYLFVLLILLWQTLLKVREEKGNAINWWMIGAVLAAIYAFVSMYVRGAH